MRGRDFRLIVDRYLCAGNSGTVEKINDSETLDFLTSVSKKDGGFLIGSGFKHISLHSGARQRT